MLQKLSVNQLGDTTCVKIYDPVKKKLIAVFENCWKAGNKMGVTGAAIQNACSRRGRTYSPILGMEVAPRLASLKEEDKERIKHCNKKILLNE